MELFYPDILHFVDVELRNFTEIFLKNVLNYSTADYCLPTCRDSIKYILFLFSD